MYQLPETILQFGGGRFLRGFVDVFVHTANLEGQGIGQIVVVQSTEGERANALNEQNGRYHIVTRGIEQGEVVDRVDEIASVRRALVAQSQWPEILAVAASPDLRYLISNTTEKGLVLEAEDGAYALGSAVPPKSFPAKVLVALKHRYDKRGTGLIILPCELIEHNAEKLLALVLEQASLWNLDTDFVQWLKTECHWLNNLVDRIVSGTPDEHPLLETDRLLAVAEPYALWAIEDPSGKLPLPVHPNITVCPSVDPYFLRKVRILNASHSALVCKAVPLGFKLVREAVADPEVRAWLERLLFEEIVPTLEGRVDAPDVFARQTLERFANPFLDHKFADISLYHETKVQVRLVPTRDEYRAKFGKEPELLNEVLSV